MCGIAGIVTRIKDDQLPARMEKMKAVMHHRGPDDEGQWLGRLHATDVGLAHTRLSIIDLTAGGHQPMISACGRYVLIYNGEIYNFKELRRELEQHGAHFVSQCDTEVVQQALMLWGEKAFSKFNGMWALAWLDRQKMSLLLSRDRFGVKPLYYYHDTNRFYFASEIKTILAGNGRKFVINDIVVGRYLQQSLLDAQPETFFQGIEAVPAGHNLLLNLESVGSLTSSIEPYWKVKAEDNFSGSVEQRIEFIRDLFLDSVRLRLRSDVPVGVLLSGGVDSSSIASAMQSVLGKSADLHMLSVVSEDPRYNEGPFIDRMTEHLGCKTHKVNFSPQEAFQILETVTWANDEPIGTLANIARYLLMQRARELGITVILSGQGADELLCGYHKYLGFYLQYLFKQWNWLKAMKVLHDFQRSGIISQFDLRDAQRYLPKLLRPQQIDIRGSRLKEADVLLEVGLGQGSILDRQMADLYRYSIPVLVHYEDRMSMAHSREIRLPFLDYRVVDSLLPMPVKWKLRDGWTKWIFRKAIELYLPPEIVWRRDKQGFSTPEPEWVKHHLHSSITKMLEGDLLIARSKLVEQKPLRQRFQAYCQQLPGKGTIWFNDIFNPIALEIWARTFESNLCLD